MRSKTLASLVFFSAALAACGDDGGLTGDDTPEPDAGPNPITCNGTQCDVAAGDITGDLEFEAANTYTLKGYIFVTGGTLTIEAGTTIKGDNGSALVITKDGKLNAVGTAVAPIVFTSSQATPATGDWGGVVMLGKAPINITGGSTQIEGLASSFDITFGGTDMAHDCGKLRYARIEYAGFALSQNNELNGLTLGGCGSATEVDFVQVHLGQDDGVEVFGGTVDLKHIVISDPDDDGLDWDDGWVGKAQFVIVKQKVGRGDKAIEADNNPNAFDNLPRSAPEIWNLTLVGGDSGDVTVGGTKKQGGMHLRRGTAGKINNSIVMLFNQFSVDIDGPESVAQLDSGADNNPNTADDALRINHTFFHPATGQPLFPTQFDFSGNPPASNDADMVDEEALFTVVGANGRIMNPNLTDPTNVTAPNFTPMAGSPVLTGCGTPSAGLDTTATFCGAIGTVDWTTGWTAYPP